MMSKNPSNLSADETFKINITGVFRIIEAKALQLLGLL
jgi:hypothetical protein